MGKPHITKLLDLPNGWHYDERWCGYCNKDRVHRCRDDQHERDQSNSFQECTVCKWYAIGIDGFKYHPPLKDDK